jgi:hypothetical protein
MENILHKDRSHSNSRCHCPCLYLILIDRDIFNKPFKLNSIIIPYALRNKDLICDEQKVPTKFGSINIRPNSNHLEQRLPQKVWTSRGNDYNCPNLDFKPAF